MTNDNLFLLEDNKSPEYLMFLYNNERKKGNYKMALKHLNRLMESAPNYFKAYYLRGNLKIILGDLNDAICDYDLCLNLNPNFADAYLNRGLTKKSIGDLEGSKEDFKEAGKLGHYRAYDIKKEYCR